MLRGSGFLFSLTDAASKAAGAVDWDGARLCGAITKPTKRGTPIIKAPARSSTNFRAAFNGSRTLPFIMSSIIGRVLLHDYSRFFSLRMPVISGILQRIEFRFMSDQGTRDEPFQ